MRAHASVRIEMRPVGVADHTFAVGREKTIFAVFEPHALMRAAIAIGAHSRWPEQHEHGVLPHALRIEAASDARRQLIETTKSDGVDQWPLGGGPPLGNHLSRLVNRNSCDVSAFAGSSRATHESSCRSISASYST